MALINLGGSVAQTKLQTYSAGYVYVNNEVLFEETSFTLSTSVNSRQINTIGASYAGEALGVATSTISVDSNIPLSGFEFEPSSLLKVGAPVNFITSIGSTEFEFNGTILECNYSHAVDTNAKVSFKARGSFAEIQ